MTNPLPRLASTPARLTLGGLAPIPFIAVVILQAAVQPGYSHVAHPISALAAFRLGWIQNINFYVLGTFTIAYAIGVHFAVDATTRRGVIGPALLGLSGVGLILCGVFPWRQDNGVLVEPAGHAVGAAMTDTGKCHAPGRPCGGPLLIHRTVAVSTGLAPPRESRHESGRAPPACRW